MVYCTSFGTARYIVKYIVKIDENNYVAFHGKYGDDKVIGAEQVFLHNTKITSSAINEAKKLKESRHKDRPKGRALAATEMMQIILGYPQIFTNLEFIKVSTLPLGERPGLEKVPPSANVNESNDPNGNDAFDTVNPLVSIRDKWFYDDPSRRVTSSQLSILKDQMESAVSVDHVTVFGLRPPELLCIDRMEDYFRLFARTKTAIVKDELSSCLYLKKSLRESHWVDCLGHVVTIRACAAKTLLKKIENKYFFPSDNDRHNPMRKLLIEVCTLQVSAEADTLVRLRKRVWEKLRPVFISGDHKDHMPIVVFSNVKPKNASKFVIHVLLSLGRFQTEVDLWRLPSMRQAFVAAGLMEAKPLQDYTLNDVDYILDTWIRDQLRFYPIGNRKFDEYIVNASNIFKKVILEDEIPMDELPPYYYTSLVQECNEDIMKYIEECKEILADSALNSLENVYGQESTKAFCPSRDQILGATKSNPISWIEHLPKTSRQSQDSFLEQCNVQKHAARSIRQYVGCLEHAAKNFLITGPPGAGKTHCMSHSIIYAMCQGLTCMTTAFLADRAFLLGGQHFHKLFKIPVREGKTSYRMAEMAIISLQRNPKMLSLLRYLDVLFIDECGQLSAELLSVLDILMRRLRDSSLFMGGVLVIGTLDQVQLRPIRGLPFLLSPFILTTFSLGKLQHYVRCSTCSILKEINEIARFFTSDQTEWDEKLRRLRHLLERYASSVPNWEDPLITDGVLRVFPHRNQKDKAVREFMSNKRKNLKSVGGKYVTSHARDVMIAVESHGEPVEASKPVTHYLNRKCSEPGVIDLYKGGIYQFTYNHPGRFNATQIGVIVDEPDPNDVKSFKDIKIMVAPAGVKTVDVSNMSKEAMFERGWKETFVGTAPEYTRTVWSQGVKAKRKQYALVLNIASTIHSAIGHTVDGIATDLTESSLWERAMVVVLLSRVTTVSQIIFVGDKSKNIDIIIDGLRKRNQYDEYMNHVVDVLHRATDDRIESIPFRVSVHPFRPKDIPLPTDTSGVVYMLTSAKNYHTVYVGFTQDMPRRLKQHNAGYGAIQSCDPLKRPWVLIGYIAGFCGDRTKMRAAEVCWQNIIAQIRPASPLEALGLGNLVINNHFPGHGLVLVQEISREV